MTQSSLKIIIKLAGRALLLAAGAAFLWAVFYLTQTPYGKDSGADSGRDLGGKSGVEKLIIHPAPKPVADFVLPQAGGDKRLAALDALDGRVLVVNYWATWCAPCRKEMPTLAALQARYDKTQLQVVAVSLDRGGADKPRAFLQEVGADGLTHWHDSKSVSARALGVYALPTTLIIDAQGREVARLLGEADWDSVAMRAVVAKFLPQ